MQTITPNTSLAQVIQNPLGRDLLEKVLLNFGFKPEDFERSALSKLKVKALSPLTGGVIKKSTVQMFCDLLNSGRQPHYATVVERGCVLPNLSALF